MALSGKELGDPGESYQVRFVDAFGKVAGTFDGTLTSNQVIDLGRVAVKSGTYTVEISSSKTVLQPFKANVKPAQPKAAKPMEEEIVVIDLDSFGQKINEANENSIDNLEPDAVTLNSVGSLPDQSIKNPEFIDKIENETSANNLTETEFQSLGEATQAGIFNQEGPFGENDSILQTASEALSTGQQETASQSLPADNGRVVNEQNNTKVNNQGAVVPFVPGQTIDSISNNANTNANTNAEEPLGGNLPSGQTLDNNSLPDTDFAKSKQDVIEKTEESPRIIQGFQSLAQNVSRGIQSLAQNLGLSSDAEGQTQNQIEQSGQPIQSGQLSQPEQKEEPKSPVYQKLLESVSTGVFYDDNGIAFYAQPGTKAYETAVDNIKTKINNSEYSIYDDNGNAVVPTTMVNQIVEIANRVLSQGVLEQSSLELTNQNSPGVQQIQLPGLQEPSSVNKGDFSTSATDGQNTENYTSSFGVESDSSLLDQREDSVQSGQSTAGVSPPEMVPLPEAQQIEQNEQGNIQSQSFERSNTQSAINTVNNINSVVDAIDAESNSGRLPQSSSTYVAEQTNNTQSDAINSDAGISSPSLNQTTYSKLPDTGISSPSQLNQTTYSNLPDAQTSIASQDQMPQRRRDRINLTSSTNDASTSSQSQEVIQADKLGQFVQDTTTGQSAPNASVLDAIIQPGIQPTEQGLNTLQQVTLPQVSQPGLDSDSYDSTTPKLFATNRRQVRPDSINEDDSQQSRINLNSTLQPRDIEKISDQIISEGLIPQNQEASNLAQVDYQELGQQIRSSNPVITGINATNFSGYEDDEEEDDVKLKSVKYITVGGDTLMKTEVPKDEPTGEFSVQQIKEALSAESIIYQELLKERERFRANLESERGNNRANLRRAEQQIQQELVKVITEQPMEAESESSSPINQIIQSIIKEDRELSFERETESIENTIQNVQERQQEANKVAQKETLEAIKTSQDKAPEKVFIDATRIIQMIQEKQKENESAKEIDEYLLRQRIERELKYEFNQMQIDHEKKLRSVYRKMIEQMYLEMLNS